MLLLARGRRAGIADTRRDRARDRRRRSARPESVTSPVPEVGSAAPDRAKRLDEMTREELIELVSLTQEEGIRITFAGKDVAKRVARKVQPRSVRRLAKYSVGSEEEQALNQVIEGENLQAMVTLYRERGQVDLILTDPPYNTGRDFRYNDRWDEDPNDPDLGELVAEDDGARHTKWMKFMLPRLKVMRDLLKPQGVLAICIDHRELFRLGQMLDEIFGNQNRISIINWQRSYTPRNDSRHVSTATEYVLVYAKDLDRAKTALLPREDASGDGEMPDGDPRPWTDGPATGSNAKNHMGMVYAIQSPFTGELLYPPEGSAWRYEQGQNLKWLQDWGCSYKAKEIDDAERRAEIIGIDPDEVPKAKALVLAEPLASAQKKARAKYEAGPWPRLYFLSKGEGRPRLKKYREDMKQGKVATNYWSNEDYTLPEELGVVSWPHQEAGHSQQAADELTAIVGPGHDFATVKPMKLFSKIIQLWCPPTGLVLDPFAGSGTTGHAVLELNASSGAERRFILIEQGRPEKGDAYARSLLAERLRRVITGDWDNGKGKLLGGGFRFYQLQRKVDAKALLEMERDEMTDAVIASHFDASRRGGPGLIIMTTEGYEYLVARNSSDEGFYLVWDGSPEPPVFDEATYGAVVAEAEKAGLKPTYHVYARFNFFQSDDVRFYQIPDQILMDFGVSVNEPFNNESET
jgi:adenine-specific DNA-methyltransferase